MSTFKSVHVGLTVYFSQSDNWMDNSSNCMENLQLTRLKLWLECQFQEKQRRFDVIQMI